MIDDKGPEEGDFPQYEGQDPYIPPVEPLPCPFCGEQPKVIPRDALEGSCWGEVYCGNHNCKVKVRVRDWVDCNDERGSEQYKRAAILNWNTRV